MPFTVRLTTFPAVLENIDASIEELSSVGLLGSQVAITPPQGDWFATFNPFVAPERQLNVDLIHTLAGDIHIGFVLSADGKWLAMFPKDGTAVIIDAERGAKICTLTWKPPHNRPYSWRRSRISNGGEYLAVKGHGSILVWDICNQRILHSFRSAEDGAEHFVGFEFFHSDLCFAGLNARGGLTLWELRTGLVLKCITLIDPYSGSLVQTEISFSGDDKFVAGQTSSGLCIWEIWSGELVDRFLGHHASVFRLEFNPNGHCLMTMTRDEVKLWDTSALNVPSLPGVKAKTIDAFKSLSRCTSTLMHLGPYFVFSWDLWVVREVENRFYFLDVQTSQTQLMLQCHDEWGVILHFDFRKGVLVTKHSDSRLRLWKISTVC